MQPVTSDPPPLGGLLFIERADELPAALPFINALLARQRARGMADAPVLGVVLGRAHEGDVGAGGVEVSHAAGLPGQWSVCWFSAPLSEAPRTLDARRQLLLDAVLERESDLRVAPVVAAVESTAREALHAALSQRYPHLTVRPGDLIDDPARGGLVRAANHRA